MARKKELSAKPALSKLELDVMGVVWRLGECSTREVIQEYQKARILADTTIKTVLTSIRNKGYLELVPTTEPGFRFRPAVSQQEIAQSSLRGVVSNFFGGSTRAAILHLLRQEEISDSEMDEIRQMLKRSNSEEQL